MDVLSNDRAVVRAFQAAALAGLAAYVAHSGLDLGGARLDGFFDDWLYSGLILLAAGACIARAVLVPAERPAWLILGIGLFAWSGGDIHHPPFLSGDSPPSPSGGDAFSLAFYPAGCAALVLFMRGRVTKFHASLWFDGTIGALAGAAIGAALVSEAVLASTGGSATAVATNLAYPLGDLLLLAFVGGAFAVIGLQPGRVWTLIGAGLAAAAIADGLSSYQAANGVHGGGTILDSLWPASALLLGYAAWQPSRVPPVMRLEGWRMLVVPSLFALTAVTLLAYDHFHPLNSLAIGLATATVLAAIMRPALVFTENVRLLSASRREALTDSLTGLGNRRKLMVDVRDELAVASAASPRILVLFDLDGFKHYNDTYGHPAGDVLLARLGGNLARAVGPYGAAYRMGGDEFCVLVRTGTSGARTIISITASALSERGEGFTIKSSYGAVILPHEARDPVLALRVADQRMYAHKDGRRSSAGRQTRDLLMQVLSEREPELGAHLRSVAELAFGVGTRLGLLSDELDEVVHAAELHDVGKVAIPDEILRKREPLDDEEWRFFRQHTLIGERILSAAPALLPVAKHVRASHEHYDGSGYPDGLAGEDIPLGARIVAVCDAFHAMTSVRPYRPAMRIDEALAELRRCAGTQFDPAVVEAFCQDIAAPSVRRDHDGRARPPTRPRTPLSATPAATGAGDARPR